MPSSSNMKLLVLLAGCFALVASEVNPLLEEVIYELDQEIQKNNLSEIELTEIKFFPGSRLVGWSLTGGNVRDISSLQLYGEDQVFEQTDTPNGSVINYDIKLTFGDLRAESTLNYHWFLMKESCEVEVRLAEGSIRLKGSVTSKNDGTCSAVLDKATVWEPGRVTVSATGGGFLPSAVAEVAQVSLNVALFGSTGIVNKLLAQGVKLAPLTRFSEILCKPLQL